MFTNKTRRALITASAFAALLPAIATVPTAATAGEAMDARYERYLEQQEEQRGVTINRDDRFEARAEQRARIGTDEYGEIRDDREINDRGQRFLYDVPRSQEQHYRG